MISKIYKLLFILFIILGNLNAEIWQRYILFNLPQGFIFEGISAQGYCGSTNISVANLTAGNPASIKDIKGISFGVSYQFETKIDKAWIADIGYKRNNLHIPQSFGFIINKNNHAIGIGYNQIYNSTMDFGKIQGTQVAGNEQGYIDIEIDHLKRNENLNKASFYYAYNLNQLYNSENQLTIGLGLNYNYYTLYHDTDYENFKDVKTDISQPNYNIGLQYNFQKKIKIGIAYSSAYELKNYKRTDIVGYKDLFIGHIPSQIKAGFHLKFSNKLSVSSDIKYDFWESLNNNLLERKDQTGIFSSFFYDLSPTHKYSFGFITTDRNYQKIDHSLFSMNDKYFVNYLTAGLIIYKDNLNIDLVIADSHLFSNDRCKNTIFKVGLEYQIK